MEHLRIAVLLLLPALLACGPALAQEQEGGFRGIAALGVSVVDRPYEDVSTDVTPAPVILGRWGNFHFEGNRVLYGLYQADGWAVSAAGQLRIHQFYEAADSPRLAGMEERERAFELGVQLTFPLEVITYQLTLVADATGAHEGGELELRAFMRYQGDGWSAVPAIAIQRQSSKLADYYFGVTPDEADILTGRPAYRPGASTNGLAELLVTRDFRNRWVLVLSGRYYIHDEQLNASPLVDERRSIAVALGIGRRF